SRRKSRRLTCIESSPLRSGLGCAKVMGMKRHVSTPSGGAAEELFGARGMIYGRFWEGATPCNTPSCIHLARRCGGLAVPAQVESLRDHLEEAGVDAGILFGTADFEPDALAAARDSSLALLRVTDGRTAFDTSGWGTPGHYPAWLPAYCAQAVGRDAFGQVRYQLLESGQGDPIVNQLRSERQEARDGGAGTAEGRDGRAPGMGG